MLGVSEVATVGNDATWVVTGNNLKLSRELARRSYRIRLDRRTSRPWEYEVSKDLPIWVARNRAKLMWSLLTIGRRWFACGSPVVQTYQFGGFQEWARTVGGVLQFSGIEGFLENMPDHLQYSDDESPRMEGFLKDWHARLGERTTTTADLGRMMRDDQGFASALPSAELAESLGEHKSASFSIKLGRFLENRAGSRYGPEGWAVERCGERQNAKLWRVTATQQSQ